MEFFLKENFTVYLTGRGIFDEAKENPFLWHVYRLTTDDLQEIFVIVF